MPAAKINKIRSIISPQGHEIAFYEKKYGEMLPNLFFLGGFHGDEPEGVYAVNQFMAELDEAVDTSSYYNLYFLPCLNPDGRKANTRVNANEVDLNRNYPTKNFKPLTQSSCYTGLKAGAPGSEAETRFMMELVETYCPKMIISVHSDLHLIDYDGPARDLALMYAAETGYRFVESVGYETSGSFGTWAGIERQIPLITLETPAGPTLEQQQKIWQQIRPAFYKTLTFAL